MSKSTLPIPTKRAPYGRHAEMIRGMKDGDNRIVPVEQVPNVRSQAARMGVKVITRRLEDGSYRVWRVN